MLPVVQHTTFSTGVKFITTHGWSIHVNCDSPANTVNMNVLPLLLLQELRIKICLPSCTKDSLHSDICTLKYASQLRKQIIIIHLCHFIKIMSAMELKRNVCMHAKAHSEVQVAK